MMMTISMKASKLFNGCLLLFLSLSLSLFDTTESRQIHDSSEESTSSIFSSTQATVAACLSAVVFLIVAVVLIFKCGDCYNSEVSTEFHPASNGGNSSRKWGGAVGYSSDQTTGGSISFGEAVDPNAGQGLPYSMIPTNVPEHGGFAGYSTGQSSGGGGTNNNPGYQNYSAASAPTPGEGVGGPRHYNPAVEQDQPPPPSYNESQRHVSMRGNR